MPDSKIVRGEVLPPETGSLRMPSGTPLGLGILGAARFGAIRRVIDAYERARRAQVTAIDAEAEVANALTRKAVANTQLRNIDTICADEESRIVEMAHIAKLRRELERMELEDEVADRKARRKKLTGAADQTFDSKNGVASDDFAAFMDDLKRMPEMVQAVQTAKDQIIKDAGGEDKLSEAQKQACEMFDAMLQSFISKKAGDSAL
jgi:hypothetical protein